MKKVFISYSRESKEHIDWVKQFAEKLRKDGINVTLDQWHLVLVDQLPQFMEKSVRENDFVLIICTPKYKIKSENRFGGVGYEGDIMTAEISTMKNNRKFIPILRIGSMNESMPSWLLGSFYVDLSKECQCFEDNYKSLVMNINNKLPAAPPIGEFAETFIIESYEIIHEINISGSWIDSANHDTIYFKQVNNRSVGIYNYGHKNAKMGVLIGKIINGVFEFEWKWFELGFKGYGRMRLSPNLMSGIWWYENKDKLIEHVGLRYLSNNIPNWITDIDFREFELFLNNDGN